MILECTRNEPATRTRVALGIFAITMMLAMPLACGGDASGSGCLLFGDGTPFEFEASEVDGFDDLSSPGASVGVALDTRDREVALIVAFRFSSGIAERTYEPTCDTEAAIGSYDFGELNSITTSLATNHPFLTAGLTDTEGVENMNHTMNALLILEDDGGGERYLLGVDGSVTLRRTLGGMSENRVTGTLVFVEITQASAAGEILPGGEVLRIEDFDFSWDTSVQPS